MSNPYPPSPVVLRNYKLTLIAFLIFLLQIIFPLSVDQAAASERYPRGYSVKALDLSRQPTVTDLMAAGQLGGALHPTHSLPDKAKELAVNASFGRAIQAWNKHEYRKAVELFRAHVAQYPDSPWAAEAMLHIGCDSLFHGRYTEAMSAFQWIMQNNANNPDPGAQMMVHKTRVRLANLKTAQGNFPDAIEQLRILKQSSPDWRQRTYAAHWIQRLSREKQHQAAVFNCGTQALAHLLKKRGKKAAAAKVLALTASSPRGQSMKELQLVAARYQYRLTGLRLTASQLKKLPLPAIIQVSAVNQGDSGHYWVLEAITKDTLRFYDPQSRRRFRQTTAEFGREWGGHALVFARRQKLPGTILAAREMANLYGGCCGPPRPASDLGAPASPPGDPDAPPPPDSPPPGCGSPHWSVNKVNMNFFVRDIPLWYRPPIGPAVEIALSYNSQSATATYEPFGNKWQFNYATYLVEDSGSQVTIFMPDGRRDVYTPDGSGGYTAPAGVYNTLVKTGDTHYELWFPKDTVFVYDIPEGTGSLQPFLVAVRDPHGQNLTFSYNAQVQLTTITDALGRDTTLTYDAASLVTAVTDPFGRQAAFEYDANRNLTKITDMGGYWSTLTYDQDIYLTSIGNPRGTWSIYTEPADGIDNGTNYYPPPGGAMYTEYRITLTNPLGFKEEYYYCGQGFGYSWHVLPKNYVNYVDLNQSNYTTPKTKYSFTIVAGNGKICYINKPSGASKQFTYDALGNINYTNDVRQIWRFVNNDKGRVTSVTDPNNKVSTMTYASNNVDLLSITNDLGTQSLTYNSTHDVISLTDRLNHTTTFTYNSYGQVTATQDALGIVTNYNYDSGHRLTAIIRDGATLHQYTYDGLDRVRTHTDPTGLTLTYDYNELDQVTRITYPDGRFKSYQYSTCCPFKVDSITERSGQTTFYSYDQAIRLTSITDPANGVTGFGYDANGNRASIVDPKGNTTSFDYDFNNRLIKKTYADGAFESYTYGSTEYEDIPASRVNARGITTNFTYTSLGKLYYFADVSGPSTYFFHDAFGRMTKAQTFAGSYYNINYTYDANSRVLSVDGPWRNVWGTPYDKIDYQYDALGRRTAMTLAQGSSGPYTSITYTYDNFNRLTEVNAAGQVYTYGYTGASPLVQSLTRPDGSVTSYEYDTLNRLAQMTTRVGETVINSYAYTYNDQDQRAGETATEPEPLAPYTSSLINYEYNNVNALLRLTDPGEKAFIYDASGNLTQGYTPEGYAFTATYDGSNRLNTLNYTDGGGVAHQTQFFYMGHSLFWKKHYQNSVLIKEQRYNYDGNLLVQERNQNNNVVNEYTHGLGLPGGIGGLLRLNQGGSAYSYLYDGKGNVTALLNSSANVAA
ncbi:MAG: cysteine peptidase family C39 domain-containing protein, partial [Syntrophales bacterium]|nr:cysteine peptidase family C39 domain-containing protein [Syntrophales bacterium]